MNNIFISYAREDRASAQKLATALAAQAWNVFWDPKIPVGKTWRQVIGSKLETAQCLVVLWSSTSIVSDWVLDEAETGRQRGILIPIVIEEGIEPPLGFRSLQAADLSKWDGSETDEVFRSLISDITEILGPAAAEEAARLRQRQDEEEQKQRDLASAALEAAEKEKARKLVAQEEAERLLSDKRQPPPDEDLARGLSSHPRSPGSKARRIRAIIVTVSLGAIVVVLLAGQSVRKSFLISTSENPSQENRNTENRNTERRHSVAVDSNITAPAGMAYVPGGAFIMGRDQADGGDDYEAPAHKVVMKPFFIDLYEVTSEDYKKCVDDGKCQYPQGWVNGNYASGTSRHPVTGVTWDQANAYARWAGKRLPTEEEWEFAARGGDGRRYPWGNDWKPGLANADGASSGVVDVGFYKGASPFGAFDMVGNAWEWTASDLKAYPGGDFPGEAARPLTVIRGGTYLSNKEQATTSFRRGLAARSAKEYGNTGFRCAKDVGVK